MLLGCTPCPRSEAVCRKQQQEHAFCDGGAKWKCVSRSAPAPAIFADGGGPSTPPVEAASSTQPKHGFFPDGSENVGAPVRPAAPESRWLSPGSVIAATLFLFAAITVGATAACVAHFTNPIYGKAGGGMIS